CAASGKLDEAIANFQESIRLQPTSAETHFNLAVILRQQGRLHEAANNYLQALHLNPEFAEARQDMANLGGAFGKHGMLAREQGKRDEAIACFRKVIELQPQLA